MLTNITPQELFQSKEQGKTIVVDVRAPKEFEEATIPGAINIPLFTDDERAQVGTLYKQQGQEAAKDLGLEIFSKKLPAFIQEFKQLKVPVTVFCWRGGMRSKTAATVLDLMGVPVNRLTGGIKAYRQWMQEQLDTLSIPSLYVLNGHTGNGKTLVLHQLKEEGYPVIDLEGMANHRGSIFGHIGLKPNNQRMFDLLLGEALLRYQNEPFILIEGESNRIGKVIIPERFYQLKEKSPQLFIHLPIEERVKNILADYSPHDYHDEFVESFKRIKRRIHTPVANATDKLLEQKDYPLVVENLLTHYYDPRYTHSSACSEDLSTLIEVTSVEDAREKIKQLLPLKH
ncbi:tRNA 2-selenouridine synthase [Marinilactibacillus piezotolerans]|uniref:tRNA 2-selenouridine synthase n=1 Tax=Marinilactibacillus piezotolerans TaxID=258723 RepID=A0A1I3X5J1_9LACT|nr:tRNA 2-selenouridine(34) synthase MnmH [Marinilactibacillus piezotolerans]SFK14878.1 tRNA 2-selenouridine synthase [Marinilactibacillus piezotolerans]